MYSDDSGSENTSCFIKIVLILKFLWSCVKSVKTVEKEGKKKKRSKRRKRRKKKEVVV